MIAFMVDEFSTQQNTPQYDAPPTFRDLYTVAKDYFENNFDQYVRLSLSKSQHQFMLGYRDHPKIQYLQYSFVLGDLNPKQISLHDMEKVLRSPTEPAFFQQVSSEKRPPEPGASIDVSFNNSK